ncbi:hypothetical protein TRFO_38492 [Tritrichomonas foetus]|uniref:Uncharacterized protein n=1 Tax=Tritrichomonas foetus TaxID=1144522 RepID=A0A1J4JB17_9EUKA|nr:hypothetical protein TRFO_38492 [Tritrichomonas foetus]|eukprot:OHS95431.1 hypothetical protein TRFO_38492 [Tritrichomonas foetus]
MSESPSRSTTRSSSRKKIKRSPLKGTLQDLQQETINFEKTNRILSENAKSIKSDNNKLNIVIEQHKGEIKNLKIRDEKIKNKLNQYHENKKRNQLLYRKYEQTYSKKKKERPNRSMKNLYSNLNPLKKLLAEKNRISEKVRKIADIQKFNILFDKLIEMNAKITDHSQTLLRSNIVKGEISNSNNFKALLDGLSQKLNQNDQVLRKINDAKQKQHQFEIPENLKNIEDKFYNCPTFLLFNELDEILEKFNNLNNSIKSTRNSEDLHHKEIKSGGNSSPEQTEVVAQFDENSNSILEKPQSLKIEKLAPKSGISQLKEDIIDLGSKPPLPSPPKLSSEESNSNLTSNANIQNMINDLRRSLFDSQNPHLRENNQNTNENHTNSNINQNNIHLNEEKIENTVNSSMRSTSELNSLPENNEQEFSPTPPTIQKTTNHRHSNNLTSDGVFSPSNTEKTASSRHYRHRKPSPTQQKDINCLTSEENNEKNTDSISFHSHSSNRYHSRSRSPSSSFKKQQREEEKRQRRELKQKQKEERKKEKEEKRRQRELIKAQEKAEKEAEKAFQEELNKEFIPTKPGAGGFAFSRSLIKNALTRRISRASLISKVTDLSLIVGRLNAEIVTLEDERRLYEFEKKNSKIELFFENVVDDLHIWPYIPPKVTNSSLTKITEIDFGVAKLIEQLIQNLSNLKKDNERIKNIINDDQKRLQNSKLSFKYLKLKDTVAKLTKELFYETSQNKLYQDELINLQNRLKDAQNINEMITNKTLAIKQRPRKSVMSMVKSINDLKMTEKGLQKQLESIRLEEEMIDSKINDMMKVCCLQHFEIPNHDNHNEESNISESGFLIEYPHKLTNNRRSQVSSRNSTKNTKNNTASNNISATNTPINSANNTRNFPNSRNSDKNDNSQNNKTQSSIQFASVPQNYSNTQNFMNSPSYMASRNNKLRKSYSHINHDQNQISLTKFNFSNSISNIEIINENNVDLNEIDEENEFNIMYRRETLKNAKRLFWKTIKETRFSVTANGEVNRLRKMISKTTARSNQLKKNIDEIENRIRIDSCTIGERNLFLPPIISFNRKYFAHIF